MNVHELFWRNRLQTPQSYESMTETLTMDGHPLPHCSRCRRLHFIGFWRKKLSANVCLSKRAHTKDVVTESQRIGQSLPAIRGRYGYPLTAAWFHDAGYTRPTTDTKPLGVRPAEEYLSEAGMQAEFC